ncbi:FAD-dependent oxidoreductase [Alloiococcus sp. CFN-8]|uniref:bile acid Fe-S flavoenzyme BaiCD n=1 Tax=Alloiococcus sp. CFN-8 TaxID=3416081 RepID=UPI003CE8A0E4
MSFKKLFTPIKIRGLELKNRIVFPAMGTKMPTKDRFVTDRLINYHVERAKGGCGLNFTEVTSVHTPSAPREFLSIGDDKFIPGIKKLVDAVHSHGGKIGLQLWQGGIAVTSYGEAITVVPSDLPVNENLTFKAASKELIHEIVEAFGQAAKRAVEAGVDCLEFHGGHGYSPHAFLSPVTNRREDEYGGSLENRARYALECIRAIRRNMPEDMPLFMRVVAQDDYSENGLTIEDIISFCKMAGEAGVDVLDVSRGNLANASVKFEVPPVDLPRGFNVDNAAKIRKETGMLTVAVGRINTPDFAERILEEDKADMVVIGRGQLADPYFCQKAMEGREDEIIRCVGCNQGCFDGFVNPDAPHITCLRNPGLCREGELEFIKTESPKRILVAGGGVAGMEAAMKLKERGHEPIILEASPALGGQFVIAGAAPRKEEIAESALSMAKQVMKEGIEVRLNTPLTLDTLQEVSPDELIIAIGSEPIKLRIPGADLPTVSNSHEVLSGKIMPKGRVAVIGGGLVGLEVAELLTHKVEEITVIEMLDAVAKDLGQLRKICVMESLYKNGVKTITNAQCTEIKENSIIINKDGELSEVECDSVVIAVGARSRAFEDIKEYCDNNGLTYHVIGDALRARRALNCTQEAWELAASI